MTPDTILLLLGLIVPMLILASVFVWDLISLPNFLRLLPANIKGEPEMKPNTHDTKNWKPMEGGGMDPSAPKGAKVMFSFKQQCTVAGDGLHDTTGPDKDTCYICGETAEPTGLSLTTNSCPVCGAIDDPECSEEGHWWVA